MDGIRFGFLSSHRRGGQHTNGPDYGVVTAESEVLGVRVEIQTHSRLGPHKARLMAESLIEIAALEVSQ